MVPRQINGEALEPQQRYPMEALATILIYIQVVHPSTLLVGGKISKQLQPLGNRCALTSVTEEMESSSVGDSEMKIMRGYILMCEKNGAQVTFSTLYDTCSSPLPYFRVVSFHVVLWYPWQELTPERVPHQMTRYQSVTVLSFWTFAEVGYSAI